MYLSQLQLDPRHRDTRDWLADCHKLHRTVMAAFPQATSEAARAELGVLFRVERPARGVVPVLVQSNHEPAWSIESRALLGARVGTLDALEATIREGQQYRFRLRANPTRRVHRRSTEGPDHRELDTNGRWRDAAEIPEAQRTGIVRRMEAERVGFEGRKLGPRVELTREEDRLAWLARRGRERDGFNLLSVKLDSGVESAGDREIAATRADPGGKLFGYPRDTDRRLTIATALFEGTLRVTDAEAFAHAWKGGVGPGKAFGCGLLSMLPMT